MDLLDFEIEVETVYKPKPSPPASKPAKPRFTNHTPEIKILPQSNVTKEDMLKRLVLLCDLLKPYENLSDEAIQKLGKEEWETVRTYRIQREQLKKELA
ncbi:hypothetical protein ACXWTF_12875 [Thiomicrolovo sp. ZZH C-3]